MGALDGQLAADESAELRGGDEPGAAASSESAESTESRFVIWDELAQWSATLLPWQRWIVAQASDHGTLTPSEIDAAYLLLLRDTQLRASDDEPLSSVPDVTTRSTNEGHGRWAMTEVRDLRNVNAIPTTSRLTLGKGLTVIYGRNGSGKSGFVRILSKACFCRAPMEILPNVYRPSDAASTPDAIITLVGRDGEENVAVSTTPKHPGLQSFSVFDTKAAHAQISGDNALSFDPIGMDVFREMARVYGCVGERLRKDVEVQTVPPHFVSHLPFAHLNTQVQRELAAVRDKLDLSIIRGLVASAAEDQRALEECRAKLVELSGSTIATRRDQARRRRQHLEQLRVRIGDLRGSLGVEAQRTLHGQLIKFAECLAAATTEGAEAFKRQGLTAVGTPEWSAFVVSASELAAGESKPGKPYPADDAPCLLCQRPLDEPSASLIHRLWAFFRTPARRELEGLNASLDGAVTTLERAQTDLVPSDGALRAYLGDANPALLSDLDSFLASVESLRAELVEAVRGRRALTERELKAPFAALDAEIERVSREMEEIEAADPEKQIAQLKAREVELEARLSITALLPEMENYVHGESWCRKARDVLATSLNTRQVSTKERELFKRLVESAYMERLRAECEQLSCDVPAFQTRGQKGETLRTLKVADHEPHRVLSEGEQRALALADFLTEVGLDPSNSGIILDDPVTSMDHARKSAIAVRLAREAKCRQVIVFTHDLVFLNVILGAVERERVDCTTNWLERTERNEPGHVVADDHPACSKDYDSTKLAERSLETAKKASGSARVIAVRDGMGKLRRTLEEIVLKYLFKGTVDRWDEHIKLERILTIAWSDQLAAEVCETFRELSRYFEGHSHSEAYETPPEPADLQRMIVKVQTLIGKARAKKPA